MARPRPAHRLGDYSRRGAQREYRVNEHFDTSWNPIRDYNIDNPAHRFRAYGGTPGHWIEWGRLMLHLRAALEARFETRRNGCWKMQRPVPRHHHATWAPDGADGLSIPWAGTASLSCANACAGQSSRRWARLCPLYRDRRGAVRSLVSKWWDYCIKYLMDYENGSWWQELDTVTK
jgi:sulfoquinovose isomerase